MENYYPQTKPQADTPQRHQPSEQPIVNNLPHSLLTLSHVIAPIVSPAVTIYSNINVNQSTILAY